MGRAGCLLLLAALDAAACNPPSATAPSASAVPVEATTAAVPSTSSLTPSATVAAPLRLQPGQAVEIPPGPGGTFEVALATPDGSERFVLILASLDITRSEGVFEYSVKASPHASSRSSGAPPMAEASCAEPPGHAIVSAFATEAPTPTRPPPRTGERRRVVVATASGDRSIVAESLVVGDELVIWKDATHPTTLDETFVTAFLADCAHVLPRARSAFGSESDIDGDGRIHLVFTPLTGTRVAFFSACDLSPALEGCAHSNAGEYLYVTPPDALAPPYNGRRSIEEIFAHELGHLLHASRKLVGRARAAWNDGQYLTEGLGALAQDVTGLQVGNLYVTRAGLLHLDQLSLFDLLFRQEAQADRDGALRGAGYLFVRYLYDRAGGDRLRDGRLENLGGPSLIVALTTASEPLVEALPRVLHQDLEDVAMDFFTTLALSNREKAGGVAPRSACHRFLPTTRDPIGGEQRGADLYAHFHGQSLSGPPFQPAASADGQLRRGGVEYLELEASPGAGGVARELRVDPGARPRLRVARLK